MTKEEMMLYKILESRELRWRKQKDLIEKFNCSLVSFTLNIPGDQKDSSLYTQAHREGVKVLTKVIYENNLEILNKEVIYKETGAEAYISVQCDAYKLKELTVDIEESNPLGRIYDIDVIGKNFTPISRTELDLGKRKCFICEESANVCRKNGTHSLDELIGHINELLKDYFNSIN